LRHRQRRAECPISARGCGLDGRRDADATDEIGVTRRTEPDVVRKHGRADDVAMTVYGIDAEQNRNRDLTGLVLE
jgi:hypothetical protein